MRLAILGLLGLSLHATVVYDINQAGTLSIDSQVWLRPYVVGSYSASENSVFTLSTNGPEREGWAEITWWTRTYSFGDAHALAWFEVNDLTLVNAGENGAQFTKIPFTIGKPFTLAFKASAHATATDYYPYVGEGSWDAGIRLELWENVDLDPIDHYTTPVQVAPVAYEPPQQNDAEAVPEPSTLALSGIAFLLYSGAKWANRRNGSVARCLVDDLHDGVAHRRLN